MKIAANLITQALPLVTNLKDCASYGRVVESFGPQFRLLPGRSLETIGSLHGMKELYLSTNPLVTAVWLSIFVSPIFLVAAEVTRNYSQVDRFWSILPTLFHGHYYLWAFLSGMPMQRLNTLMALSVAWSIRLSFNYWRKGGYTSGSEDYRWPELRRVIPRPLFFVLNVFFISTAQCLLLMSITFPAYILLVSTTLLGNEMKWPDLIAPWIVMGLVLCCFFADQQQWEFHEAKNLYKKTAKPSGVYTTEDLDRGFNTRHLFAYSRHPNFASEQCIWVSFYLWSCALTGTLYNWSGIGAVSYLCLFQASTWYTELLTGRKYPEYREYQRLIGKFLPSFASLFSLQGYRELKTQKSKKLE